MIFRKLNECEIPAALSLAWEVFREFESPIYPPSGTEEFRKALHDENYLAGMEYFGVFDGARLIGMAGVRKACCHICFFFVEGSCHRRGIGTRLFELVRAYYPGREMTLNASPYGLPFYHAVGFTETDREQDVNGVRFTPMSWRPGPTAGGKNECEI